MPKLYFGDTGILKRVASVSLGQLFENAVFIQLFTRQAYARPSQTMDDQIHYYQRKSGAEIDFIVNRKTAYEVKTLGSRSDVSRLQRASKRINIPDYHVVSLEKSLIDAEHVIYPFGL